MKKHVYFIGIDNGGSAIKAAVFNENGRELSVSQVQIPMDHPNPGWTERDPHAVWRGNCQVIRDAIGKAQICAQNIKGVSVCGYGGGLGLLDSANSPIAPFIVSTDTRAQSLLGEYSKNSINSRLYQLTLQNLWAGQQAMLLPWLKKHQPDLLKQACHMVCIKDYIRYCLTGMLATDYTDASCTNLFNIRDKQFDPEIFELLDIREYFRLACVPILQSFETGGFVTSQAAIQCGLPEGIPVAAGLYDVDSCCLASGILDSSCLCLITGTWSINEYLTDDLEECIGKNGNTIAFLPDYYIIEESSPTSASNFDWYADHFLSRMYPGLERRELYDYCNKSILESGLKQTDILFMPYLFASNSVPDAKGAFLNLDSSHSPMDILLAIYEGILFSSCYHIEKLTGTIHPQKQIRLSGGITNSPVWTQILADILQLPIQVMEGKERGALGAAICASVACEYYPDFHSAVKKMCHLSRTYIPDSSKAVFYKEKYEKFKKAIQALEVFYK